MTLSVRVVKEKRLFRAGRGVEGVGAAAARAERRRRPATWAGFRPVILRSTSTMVMFFVLGFLEIYRKFGNLVPKNVFLSVLCYFQMDREVERRERLLEE